jgi:hypothetical protein
VYGWYLRELPWPIDTTQCVTWDDYTVLDGDIAPQGTTRHRPAS